MDVKRYELVVASDVEAVQWVSDLPEQLACEIVEWVEGDWNEEVGGAAYDSGLSGASGPKGQDWGCLEITYATGTTEVAPYDYVVRDATGKFVVISPDRFEAAYLPPEDSDA